MTIDAGGAFPVLPTIFDTNGIIDEVGFRSVIEFVIGCRVDGVVFPGLASEYDQLTLTERKQLVAIVGGSTRGRVAFVVGASGQSLEETLHLLSAGEAAGAGAAMVMTPGRMGADLGALIEFYRCVGDSTTLPIMVQNAPPPMGSGLSPEQLLGLVAAVPSIAYVKEENMPCGQRITALLANAPPNLRGVFGGAGGRYITDELKRGAIGTMPAAELPELSVALVAAHRARDESLLRDLHERLLPVLMMQAVFRWDLTKEVLRRRGLIASAHVRAHGPRFDAGDVAELDALLARLVDLVGPIGRALAA